MAGNSNSGRHALPINQHLDRGTWRGDKHGPIPDAAEGLPECPKDFGRDEKAAWKKWVMPLVELGTAKAVDTPLLIQMCETWVLYKRCLKLLKIAPHDKDLRLNTLAFQQTFERLRRLWGGTARDRQRMRLQKKDDGPKGVATRTRA